MVALTMFLLSTLVAFSVILLLQKKELVLDIIDSQ